MTWPTACCSAYAVVGPTKRKPASRSAFASAVDSGVVAGHLGEARRRSAARAGGGRARARRTTCRRRAARAPRGRSRSSPRSSGGCARCPRPRAAAATSASPNAGDQLGIEAREGARNASRLRRIVSHERPDWNPSRLTRSYRPRSSTHGAPPLLVVVALVQGVAVAETANSPGKGIAQGRPRAVR